MWAKSPHKLAMWTGYLYNQPSLPESKKVSRNICLFQPEIVVSEHVKAKFWLTEITTFANSHAVA